MDATFQKPDTGQYYIIGERSEPSLGRWMEKLFCRARQYVVYIYTCALHSQPGECTEYFTDST